MILSFTVRIYCSHLLLTFITHIYFSLNLLKWNICVTYEYVSQGLFDPICKIANLSHILLEVLQGMFDPIRKKAILSHNLLEYYDELFDSIREIAILSQILLEE